MKLPGVGRADRNSYRSIGQYNRPETVPGQGGPRSNTDVEKVVLKFGREDVQVELGQLLHSTKPDE